MGILIQKDGIKSTFEIHDTSLTQKLSDGVKRNVIFTITGASGVGKDEIVSAVLKTNDNYIKPVSFTTRPIRPGEIEGVDYYFITKEEFQKLLDEGKIFEHTKLKTGTYGYTNEELERVFETGKIPVCIVDEVGMNEICNNITGDLNVFKTFILPPTALELKNRLKGRELKNAIKNHVNDNSSLTREDLISIKRKVRKISKGRFSESKHWIRTAQNKNIYDGFLVNDDLDGAITITKEIFEKVINGELK